MAVLTQNINYSGVDVEWLVTNAINDTSFRETWGAQVFETVKDVANWHDVRANATLVDYACAGPVPENVVLAQRRTTLCSVMSGWAACAEDIAGTYRSLRLRAGLSRQSILDDSELSNMLQAIMLEQFANQVDILSLRGQDYTYGGELTACPGISFLEKLEASTEVRTINAPATITAANVIDSVLEAMLIQYPSQLRFRGTRSAPLQPKFAVSVDIADAYRNRMNNPLIVGGNGPAGVYAGYDPSKSNLPQYAGIDIVVLNNLPPRTAWLTYPANTAIFVDAMTDLTQLRIVDQSLYGLSDQVVMKLQTRVAADFGIADEIVFLRPA